MQRLGGDPKRINPLVPVDLVIDHSVQVDFFGTAATRWTSNVAIEFQRNRERYEFLRWGQKAFDEFPRRAAGRGHRAPGQPRIPGQGRLPARGRRRAGRLARHAGRHRQPYHDDQRPGRAGLGRGRHRGRGRHARPAAVHARPRGDRLRAHRPACRPAPRPPTWCSPSRRSSARKAWSTSSSSISGPAHQAA